jgi:hypothetical protein
MKKSRNTDIMADSAYVILTSNKSNSGNFYIVLKLLFRMKKFYARME